jgi:hypothetical protein
MKKSGDVVRRTGHVARSIVEHSDEAPLFERRIQLSSWACQRDAMRCSDAHRDRSRNDLRHDDALQ